MAKKLNKEFAAAVLLEAQFSTDLKAAARYGITDRMLRYYRERLSEDEEFLKFFKEKKEEFDRAWADELPVALRKGVRTLVECTDAVAEDPRMKKSPQVIDAVSGAVKTLAEIQIVSRMIDARLAEQGGARGAKAPADVPGPGGR